MFGFTKLTPEETAERDIKLRIKELDVLLTGETLKRAESLKISSLLRDELEKLLQGE
jgi:hypothetical protein